MSTCTADVPWLRKGGVLGQHLAAALPSDTLVPPRAVLFSGNPIEAQSGAVGRDGSMDNRPSAAAR